MSNTLREKQAVERGRGTAEIDDLLTPVSCEVFEQKYLNKSFLFGSGDTARFAHLVSWEELNERLSFLRTSPQIVRVTRRGITLDAKLYLSGPEWATDRKVVGPRLEALLKDGATLFVEHAEDVFDGLRDVSLRLSRVFRCETEAILVASYGTEPGLDLHWDIYDAFVCQVTGKKIWKVYEPTQQHPVAPPTIDCLPHRGRPVWENALTPGDMLYLPRGWPHSVDGTGTESIHVAFAVRQPYGASLVGWAIKALERELAGRRPLPLLASHDEQREYVEDIRRLVLRTLDNRAIPRFYDWLESKQPASRRMSLGPVLQQPVEPRYVVRERQRLTIEELDAETVQIVETGVTLFASKKLEPALGKLSDLTPMSERELLQLIGGGESSELRRLISLMCKTGILVPVTGWS